MALSFSAICSLLQSIENITTRQPQLLPADHTEGVRQIISNWFTHHRCHLDGPATDGAAVLSALLPHRRKDRVYGIKSPLFAKKLSRLLGFNYTQRTLFSGWTTGAHGDLGVYVERAMRPWDGTFSMKHAIPVDRVDNLLVQLAARHRCSNAVIRSLQDRNLDTDAELRHILVRLESWEAKWLTRLILRDYCTLDLDEHYIFQQYHFLLPELLKFQDDFDAAFNMLRGDLKCFPSAPSLTEEAAMRVEAAQKLKPIVGVKVGRPRFLKAWSFKHGFQLVGNHAWAAEVKYDGEYCEIHVDLANKTDMLKIYSKNGKDATADRIALHSTICDALRIGRPDCAFKQKCIALGEMVLYSDKEQKIMPFSKIRKHVSRSGSFIGVYQDSLPHEWEHLMVVFFDVLVLDDEPVLRHGLQKRRRLLRRLIKVGVGRSMRSEWSLLDFKTGDGIMDFKQAFARTLANHQEGLILKPLHAPYFPLAVEQGRRHAQFFIKVKQDFLADMGGQRDLGDFAVIGASFDAQVAPRTDVRPLHWTHFYLGCCTNIPAVQRRAAKPLFKIVAVICFDKCISKPDLAYLNTQGYVRQTPLHSDGSTTPFDICPSLNYVRPMTTAFAVPFVVEVLGSGFQQAQNEDFDMLRHPRVTKVHSDRTWEDTVTLADLAAMASESGAPDSTQLDGHARDVALLASKYRRELGKSASQSTASPVESMQTTQRSSNSNPTLSSDARSSSSSRENKTPSTPPLQPLHLHALHTPSTPEPTQHSTSTQATGTQASRNLHARRSPAPMDPAPPPALRLAGQKRSAEAVISPPKIKRQWRTFGELETGGCDRERECGLVDGDRGRGG